MITEIKKEEIRHLGLELMECSNQINQKIQQLNQLLEQLQEAWSGEDANIYQDAIRSKYIIGLQELAKQINHYGTYLNKVPGAYELLDKTFAQRNINI